MVTGLNHHDTNNPLRGTHAFSPVTEPRKVVISNAKEIPLTQGQFAIVDDEDYDWLTTWKWHAHQRRNHQTYYVRACTGNRIVTMHRLIMMYPVGLQIDHINYNGLDNRKSNLRIVTNRQNHHNLQRRSSSIYPGVSWNQKDKKWKSQIHINGHDQYLGSFDSEFNAREAYESALQNI